VPEGIIFQSGTAYKSLRKMLVDTSLVAVVSLPAGVFNPYSGVKTSILILDKRLHKQLDRVLFVKVGNDGFNLGAQRRVAAAASELRLFERVKDSPPTPRSPTPNRGRNRGLPKNHRRCQAGARQLQAAHRSQSRLACRSLG
jgi:hypothetical protein